VNFRDGSAFRRIFERPVTPKPNPPSTPSPEFLAVFRAHAAANGTMPFARFMELALYDAGLGYYRSDRVRVGYGDGTDFFTASTSSPVFGELVSAACTTLLGDRPAEEFTFVEIGAGNSPGVLAGVAHPFGATRVINHGEPIDLRGECVVFSNELFDAQPFHRFVHRSGAWREIGVALQGEGLNWVELPGAATVTSLPPEAPEGYVVDAPLESAVLMERIAAQPWTGLIVAADYGKTWRELTEATPAGTARAYFRHTQSNDLLARPGEQDLTCHVCWDWLQEALLRHGFIAARVESQESFFIHHAGRYIAATTAAEAAGFSRRKLALLQLLHPAQLGQKFQVLHARRG
jgi:SAM-dependent MidA family methyltransferase